MNARRLTWIAFSATLLAVVFGSRLYSSGSVFRDFGISVALILFVNLFFLKPILLNVAPPSAEFRAANPEDFPGLDRKQWDDYRERLKSLGFLHLRDVTTSNAVAYGIFSVFLHPKTNCYGNVHQTFATRRAPGLGLSFGSYLGEQWSVAHNTNRPLPGSAIIRTRHKLTFSRPEMSVEQLYAEHLAKRDRIASGLGVSVVTPKGFETFQERANVAAKARRDNIRTGNPLLFLLRHRWAKIKPLPNDWWGDYPKEFEARTGQKFSASEV